MANVEIDGVNSKVYADQIDPKTGTNLVLGTSGDTVDIPSGVTIANAGTATGFGLTGWSTDSGTNDSLVPASASAGIYLGVAAATAANLLDDYETGVFNVTITTSSGTVAMTSGEDTMQYTKVGRVVFIGGRIDIASVSSPSGTIYLASLPFTVGALGENGDMAAFSFYGNAFDGTIGNLQGISVPSTTTIQINEFTGTTAANAGDHLVAGTDFAIGGFYTV